LSVFHTLLCLPVFRSLVTSQFFCPFWLVLRLSRADRVSTSP
jgi:hypothetical protein